jgi:hypothetical protein
MPPRGGISREVRFNTLETDWLAEAAGLEPLHLEIRSAELLIWPSLGTPETLFRSEARASAIRSSPVPRLKVLENSDLRCEGSNPAASASESVSNAYTGRQPAHGLERIISVAPAVRRRDSIFSRGLRVPGAR